MKYLILISHNEQARDAWQGMSDTERQLGVKAHTALVEELAATGELIVSEALADPATARRVRCATGATIDHRRPVRRGEGVSGRLLPGGVRHASTRAVEHAARMPEAGSAWSRCGRCCDAARPGAVSVTADVEDLLRELAPQVLAALVRRHGGFDTCEDAVQEALLAAAVQWPDDGLPDNPRAG